MFSRSRALRPTAGGMRLPRLASFSLGTAGAAAGSPMRPERFRRRGPHFHIAVAQQLNQPRHGAPSPLVRLAPRHGRGLLGHTGCRRGKSSKGPAHPRPWGLPAACLGRRGADTRIAVSQPIANYAAGLAHVPFDSDERRPWRETRGRASYSRRRLPDPPWLPWPASRPR